MSFFLPVLGGYGMTAAFFLGNKHLAFDIFDMIVSV
jgi:hypothetical protein